MTIFPTFEPTITTLKSRSVNPLPFSFQISQVIEPLGKTSHSRAEVRPTGLRRRPINEIAFNKMMVDGITVMRGEVKGDGTTVSVEELFSFSLSTESLAKKEEKFALL